MEDWEVTRQRADAEMMKRPHLWPGMLLPMKREGKPGEGYETGIYCGRLHDGRVPIYNANLAEASMKAQLGDRNEDVIMRVVGDPTCWKYDSPEAAVADGWIVD